MSCTTIGETTQKAKKEHRCSWCGQQILVGELLSCAAESQYSPGQIRRPTSSIQNAATPLRPITWNGVRALCLTSKSVLLRTGEVSNDHE